MWLRNIIKTQKTTARSPLRILSLPSRCQKISVPLSCSFQVYTLHVYRKSLGNNTKINPKNQKPYGKYKHYCIFRQSFGGLHIQLVGFYVCLELAICHQTQYESNPQRTTQSFLVHKMFVRKHTVKAQFIFKKNFSGECRFF